jgi:HEAT repeat protein/beta-lactamase regulating signal transducer with metallopeptidase domain
MKTADALAWLLTYALHSTLFLGGAWLLAARRVVRSHHAKDLLWKTALVGGIVTASAQTAARSTSWSSPIALPASRPALVVGSAERPMPTPMGGAEAESQQARPVQAAAAAPSLTSGITMLWAMLAAVGLAAFAVAHVRLSRRLGERREVSDEPIRGVLDGLCRSAGVRRPIRLTRSEGLGSPVALGRSEICVPGAVLTELDPIQQRSVLAHELAHLTRNDPLWLTAGCVVERVFFFQPLNRIARKRIQESAEYLCDDWAAERSGSGVAMAKSLMKVAEWMQAPPSALPLAGMAENPSQLVERVRRLVERRGAGEVRRRWLAPAAVGLVILTAASVPGVAATAIPGPGLLWDQGQESDTLRLRRKLSSLQPLSSARLDRIADRAAADASRKLASADLDVSVDPEAVREGIRKGLETAAKHAEAGAEAPLDTVGIAALIAALRDSDAGVRRAAAHSLGNIENPRAVDPLVAALKDSDVEVRRNVVWALGNIEDRRAVPGLITALRDSDVEVRKSAAWALGNIEDPSAAEALASVLKDESPEVRKNAAWALGELELTEAPAGLIDAMRDRDPEVRKTATWAVGEMGDARAVPALRTLLSDASPEVRQNAIHALSEIRDAAALEALIDAMKSSDAEVRRQAAEALGQRN